jgi:ABC-type multidrug transport system fused ATPase/permease subunit
VLCGEAESAMGHDFARGALRARARRRSTASRQKNVRHTLGAWSMLSLPLRRRWSWLVPIGVVAAGLDLAAGVGLVRAAGWLSEGATSRDYAAVLWWVAVFVVVKTGLRMVETRRREACVEAAVTELAARVLGYWLHAPLARQLEVSPTRRAEDVQALARDVAREGVQSLVLFCSEGLVVIGMLGLLFFTAPGPAMAVIVGFGLVAAAGLRLAQRRHGASSAALHEERVGLAALVHGCLAGAQEIKIGARQDFFLRRFARRRDAVGERMVAMETWRQAPLFINEAIFLLAVLALLALAPSAGAAAPTVLVFFYAGLRLLPAGNRLIYRLLALRVAEPAAERLLAMRAEGLGEPQAAAGREKTTERAGMLEVREVSFRYPGGREPVLRDVSLVVRAGERVALVGPSGGGKSTLLMFCAGLLAPEKGEVLVDGRALGVDDHAWQAGLGYVGQQTVLLEGTLGENIALGATADQVDERALGEALAITGLDAIAAGWPEGLAKRLAENGGNLSGGQRQRVAIARELYRKPDWLLLDEATAFLDPASEQALTEALGRERPGLTTIIVTHRAATARTADRVVFIREGRIEACGPFEEILAGHAGFRSFMNEGGTI